MEVGTPTLGGGPAGREQRVEWPPLTHGHTLWAAALPIAAALPAGVISAAPASGSSTATQSHPKSLRGDPAAIADAEAMVETMGGKAIWAELGSIHLVHEWHPWHRMDRYVEDEILDFTGPRSRADRKSEINHQIRAYNPEGRRWSLDNGTLAHASREQLERDLKRAPFNFFRLVRGVARGDPFYEVRFADGDIPGTRRIDFLGPDGVVGGWVILNARKEPIVKATPVYRYTLGPLKRFGNLRVPAWGVYDNGTTRYEMVSLGADRDAPERSLFLPPANVRK